MSIPISQFILSPFPLGMHTFILYIYISIFLCKWYKLYHFGGLPGANAEDARDMGLIPRGGRSPGVGNGNPIQYSCLENCMDRGAWWAIVHWLKKSQKQLSTHAHTIFLDYIYIYIYIYTHTHTHTHRLRYNTCFSLSDLLHSVLHSLSPSRSLQMT